MTPCNYQQGFCSHCSWIQWITSGANGWFMMVVKCCKSRPVSGSKLFTTCLTPNCLCQSPPALRSVSLPWKSVFWPGLCCRLRREKEPCLAMRASPLPPLKMIFRLHRELWRTAIEVRHQPGKVVISQKPLTDFHDLMNSTSFSMVWGHENHSNWCKHPAQHLSTVQNPLSPFILVGQWVSHNYHNPAHIG